ncbi:hypothetical protein GQ54DRAFT_306225 [Martensiomyces pterosporus]|nr:hypothetical protein GQ54DRAFT_306225 [Martensiomyces pterosporus]
MTEDILTLVAPNATGASVLGEQDVGRHQQQLPLPRRRAQSTAHRLMRRSFSGDYKATVSSSQSYDANNPAAVPSSAATDKMRLHQRTTSASSLTSATLMLTANSSPSPTKRANRFASALRSGLSRSSTQSNLLRPTAATLVPILLAKASTTVSTTSDSSSIQCSVSAAPCMVPPPLSAPSTSASHPQQPGAILAAEPSAGTCAVCAPVYDDDAGPLAAPSGGFRPRKRSLSVGGENMCRDFFARQIEQYGLQSLLTSPVAVCYFMASTISNFSPESLLFYLEAEHYRTANFPSEDRRKRYAKGLYKAFISHSAPLEINISHSMRQRITQVFRSGGPITPTLFQETQSHTYALLDQDFALFRQRTLFNRMVTELSSASTATGTAPRKDSQTQRLRAVAALYDALSKTYGVYSLPPSKSTLVESEMPSFTKFADMELTSTDVKIALPAWLCRTTIRLLDTPMPSSYEESCQLQRSAGESASQLPYTRQSVSTCGPSSIASSTGSQHRRVSPSLSASSSLLVARKTPAARPSSSSQSASDSIEGQGSPEQQQQQEGHVLVPPELPSSAAAISPAVVSHESTAKKANKQKSLQRLRTKFQLEGSTAVAAQSSTAPSPLSTLHAKSRWGSLWGSRRRKN